MPSVLRRVDARLGTQWFVWTNAKLLVPRCMRYSMTQAFFMPFTNTGLSIAFGRVLTSGVRRLDQARSDNGIGDEGRAL
jgi:hypothetical protein